MASHNCITDDQPTPSTPHLRRGSHPRVELSLAPSRWSCAGEKAGHTLTLEVLQRKDTMYFRDIVNKQ